MARNRAVICLLSFCTYLISAGPAEKPEATLPPPASHEVDFVKDIKPLFESSCIQCHAKGKTKGGLSLETRESFLKGGDSGPAAIVGKSADSYIVKLVAGVDPDEQMPKKGKKWTQEQVGLLRAWIDQGANWDPKISFARPEPANLKVRVVELPEGNGPHPIDRLLDRYFLSRGVTPSSVVDDAHFARRAYLDAIGLIPTVEQLDAFIFNPSPDKRSQLVRKLLADKRNYADHWLTFWNDLLRNDYRGTGFIDGGRRQITGWLYKALVKNEPYDQFVAQLVDPPRECEGFARGIIWRGTVNASQLPPMQAAQNTAQVFMGVNLKCASCHDSFVNDYTLADAYGLAAVFSDGPLELVHCDQPTGQVSVARALYSQLGTIDPRADRAGRMKELSRLLTSPKNGRLSRTVVNRLWAKLMGRGFVEPVDDMDKPAWDPDLLDWLADDLVAHHYDLKHTIELIMTSQAYQLPSSDAQATKEQYVFRGPLLRRLTAEQFCDAITELTDGWARFPDTLDINFTDAGLTGPTAKPTWIWTDEPVDQGQARADDQARFSYPPQKKADAKQTQKPDEKTKKTDDKTSKPDEKAVTKPDDKGKKPDENAKKPDDKKPDDAAADDKKDIDPRDVLPRHKVSFRKTFTLDKLPREAFAAVAASQSVSAWVNGKGVAIVRADGERAGRIMLLDLRPNLAVGRNVIILDVSSHSGKNLNDAEIEHYSASRNHLNTVSGVGFYLRVVNDDGRFIELTSSETWRTWRAPEGSKYKAAAYDDSEWLPVVTLPEGVAPVDEGPALPPITRRDFANEPIEIAEPFRNAISTAVQTGHIRAPLQAADTLMTALDRPNHEQVMTTRITAATTLQALELTNGNSFNDRIKRAARKLTPETAKDPQAWVIRMYRQLLGRGPDESELKLATELLGDPVKEDAVVDFLWAVIMSPEFDFIN
jgi:hypothetical protein